MRCLTWNEHDKIQNERTEWKGLTSRPIPSFELPVPRIKQKANATELPSKLSGNPEQAVGIDLLGSHYKPCRA